MKIRFELVAVVLGLVSLSIVSCGSSMKKQNTKTPVSSIIIPAFNADSAWAFAEKQTLFGPRVPNTKEHDNCRQYLSETMQSFGAEVIEQKADLKAFDGTILKSTNIIASFDPQKQNRILLCAHWDSRPWSDNDPNSENWKKPVMGANDGASGVAVLMEVARAIGNEIKSGKKSPNPGIDIIFFDAEDYGTPQFYKGDKKEDTWALGSQYWSGNKHKEGYKAKYGILLDMVGRTGASFKREYFSMNYASDVVEKVWNAAQTLGHGSYFKKIEGGAIDDDHLYINKIGRIPCIDIIDNDESSDSGFPDTWHTQNDIIKYIDKSTLKAVGETLLKVLYEED